MYSLYIVVLSMKLKGAIILKMALLDTGDASQQMTCAACYVRFELRDGRFSCQLILAKAKIVQEGTTLSRTELLAAVLNVLKLYGTL